MKRTSKATRHHNRATFLFTCEHASNRVPASLQQFFSGHANLLTSHRGWDEGALSAAKIMAKTLNAPLIHGKFSRLAIDLNRSLHHRRIFSEIAQNANPATKRVLITRVYQPFRNTTLAKISHALLSVKKVHHFSIHSFTPILKGEVRDCEIGILYDPKRPAEKQLARKLKEQLKTQFPGLRVKLNYPYRGTADGHTTHLRKQFSNAKYTGIEIELNQAWVHAIRRSAKSPLRSYRLLALAIKTAAESS